MHVRVVRSLAEANEIAREALDKRHRLYTADLTGVNSGNGLIEALASTLDIPDYYGRNWDAFDECLGYLDIEASGGLLLCTGADALLGLPRRELATFLRTLEDAGDLWRSEGISFRSVLVGSDSLLHAIEAARTE